MKMTRSHLGSATAAVSLFVSLMTVGAQAQSYDEELEAHGRQLSTHAQDLSTHAKSLEDLLTRVTDLEHQLKAIRELAPKDLQATNLRIVSGRTSPNDWKHYVERDEIVEGAINVEVDLSQAGFTETPRYLISLHGKTKHWQLLGTASVYQPTRESFSVYLKSTSLAVNPEYAARYEWSVSWLAIGR